MPMLGRPLSLGSSGFGDEEDDDLEAESYEFVDDSELLLKQHTKDMSRLSREELREAKRQ
jgi:hypothetical protein